MANNPFFNTQDLFYHYTYAPTPKESTPIINTDLGSYELQPGYNIMTRKNDDGTEDYSVIAPSNTPQSQQYSMEMFNKMAETHSESSNTSDNHSSNNIQNKVGNVNQKQLLSTTIDKLSQADPKIGDIKDFLMNTAAFESKYVLNSRSKNSSASGWFQFIDSTRNNVLNKLQLTATKNEFLNNPEIQVKAASKLYYDNLETAKNTGILKAAHSKGYSTSDVMHAMWLNPKWAKNFFLYGIKGGKDANGTDIEKYLKGING